MTLRIAGKTWRITRRSPDQKLAGMCDYKHRRIYIAPDLRGRKLVEIAMHEVLHAAAESLDEDWVETTAKSAARLAWRLLAVQESGASDG